MTTLPPRLVLELTTRCNYRCPFCYCVWHEDARLGRPALSTAAWKRILDEIADQGVHGILFTGGEALLRRDIWEILRYARKRMPKGVFSLFTNGSRVTEAMLRKLKRLKVFPATSLPGLRTYGEMTGTKRSPMKVLALMARAAELHWPIAVSITVTKVNLPELSDIYAAAVLSHAKEIQVGAMMVEGRGRLHPELALTPDEWAGAKESLKELVEKLGVPTTFGGEILCSCRPHSEEIQERFFLPRETPCEAGKSFGVVGPNGKYRICLHHTEQMEWK